jgi:hypothetical protein
MTISESTFSFRDYIAYMFPGLVVIGVICVLEPSLLAWAEKHKLTGAAVVLAGSHIIGTLSLIISYRIFTMLLYRLFGDPRNVLFGRNYCNVWKLSTHTKKTVIALLEEYWGHDLTTNAHHTELLNLCLRQVQNRQHPALDYIARSVSLYNYCCAMCLPGIILLVTLATGGHIAGAAISAGCVAFFASGHYHYSAQVSVIVFMLFYTIYRHNPEGQEISR